MNKRNTIIIVCILVFIALVGGISYSYFVYNKDIGTVSLNTGNISINYSNVSGTTTLSNVTPLSDTDGMSSSEYIDFTVTATVDTETIYYEIYIMPKSGNTLDTSYLKTYLTDQTNHKLSEITLYNNLSDSSQTNGKTIYKGLVTLNSNGQPKTDTRNFRLRMWLDETYFEQTAKTFEFDVYVNGYNIEAVNAENISYGSDPNCNTVQCQLEELAE